MASITTWTRLEPRCRSADLRTSLEARVHDPLWLLGRQWQLGEFRGTDGGSPVFARFRGEASSLTRYVRGWPPADGRPAAREYASRTIPLEALVEREPIRVEAGPRFRLAAEAGLHFLRLLAAEGAAEATRAAYVKRYRLEASADERDALDADTTRFLSVVAGRVPDGMALHRAMRAGGPAGRPPGMPPEIEAAAEIAKVARAATRWLEWYGELFSEPGDDPPAWMPERMEYAFALAGRTGEREVVLTAREYAEGRLDWYAFDVAPRGSLGAPAESTPVVAASLPAPLGFRGMPAPRWWEFEDAQVDLGALEAEPEDLARLLLVEFAVLYGNDWFLMPVEVPVGALCRPRSLVVRDTFGEQTLIRPYAEVDGADAPWRLFHLSPDFLLLAPVLGASLEGRPIEEVLFLRDEMANMAWAVERVVESRAGRRLERAELYQQEQARRRAGEATPPPPSAEPTERPLAYRLASDVPPYWIPLVPQKVDAVSIRLRRGRMLQPDGSPAPIRPLGRILEPGRPLSLHEEEVPRAGARVTRTYQYARWIDGSTHVWVGRRKQPGRGEGSSGLRFDIVEPPPA